MKHASPPLGMLLLASAICAVAEPAARRLDGLQVWNCEFVQNVAVGDFYGPNFQKLQPVRVVGVRNGVFSGRLAATNCMRAIQGLKAQASDLVAKQGGAKIAAAEIRVRFAELAVPSKSWMAPYRFDGLLDAAPAEVPVADMRSVGKWKPAHEGPVATVPIWITVRIPPSAAPGEYEGKVTIAAEQDAPLDVPIHLKVHAWTLPDPKDFSVHNLAYLAQACVARSYKVPLWSDKHFELMGKSMELMAEVGSRAVMVHLVTGYYAQDTEESMVKWVRQADGSYKHDFTAFDKYLDVCGRKLGKPYPLRINMWAIKDRKDPDRTLPVTAIDAASGKAESVPQPPYGTPESLAFWRPVLAEIRARIEKRGWFDVTVVGDTQYCGGMDPGNVTTLKRIWPDAKGYSTQHGWARAFPGKEKADAVPVPFAEMIWTEPPVSKERYRKARDPQWIGASCGFARNRHGECYRPQMIVYRTLAEEMLLRGLDGIGQFGVDLWPMVREDGRISRLGGGHAMGPDSSTRCILAPGPDGPIATERYEMFREGVEACEAILFLQRLLDEKKLEGDLAQRVAGLLKGRAAAYADAAAAKGGEPLAQLIQGAQDREDALFALAAEAAKVTGGPK